MSTNLILHELRRSRRSWLAATLITLGLLALMLGNADSFIGNPDMENLLAAMPKGMLDAFGIKPESFLTFEGYFASQPFTYILLLLGSFAAVWATLGIAKEKDRGTAELLFTLPYRRSVVFFSKAAAHLLMITAAFALTAGASIVFGQASTGLRHTGGVALLMLGAYLISLAFAGIGYAITCWVGSERTASSIGIGIVMASFILSMVGGAGPFAESLSKLSLFRLFDASAVVTGAGLTTADVLVTLGLYAAGLAAGAIALKRRDLI